MTRSRTGVERRDAPGESGPGERREAVPQVPAARPGPQAALRRNLSSAGVLRQAFLLAEVLGPPKALREPEEP